MKPAQVLRPPLYETTDLNLASALLASGHSLTALRHEGAGRYRFCFTETPELLKIAKTYWNRKLAIEPQTLFECQRTLKSRIHNPLR